VNVTGRSAAFEPLLTASAAIAALESARRALNAAMTIRDTLHVGY
jgi:hypothetical protein